MIDVIRKPEITKKKSTPAHPQKKNLVLEWKAMTDNAASALKASNSLSLFTKVIFQWRVGRGYSIIGLDSVLEIVLTR
jgi:hypothetical protein